MIEGLIGLLIVILVVAIVAAAILYGVELMPIDANFKQIIRLLVLLIAVLIILLRALPLLGVATI